MDIQSKKKADNEAEVKIGEGVDVEIKDNQIFIKGKLGELSREYPSKNLKISKKNNSIIIKVNSEKRRHKALRGTWSGHIQNMMRGVSEGITYRLKVVYSHFPMNIKTQENTVIIENFLGERFPRKTKILKNVSVNIKGQDITVTGFDKENVAQTAANIEQATKICRLDPRVFQDGIYITEKDGKKII